MRLYRAGLLVALGTIAIRPAAAMKPVYPRPAGNPGDWVRPDDYPPDALRGSQQGNTAFRLDVDRTGAVSRCTVTASSGSDSLDHATCALLTQRARFIPARDRRGRPQEASYSSVVRWQIPSSSDTQPGCHPQRDDAIHVAGMPDCY